MINAKAFKFIHNLNDKTGKWLENAKRQIKANGIKIVSNNANNDIVLDEKEIEAAPIFDDKTNAKIQELENEIAKIKAEATPINKGQKILKQTIYVKHIEDNIIEEVNKLLTTNVNNFDNATIKALNNVKATKTHIH